MHAGFLGVDAEPIRVASATGGPGSTSTTDDNVLWALAKDRFDYGVAMNHGVLEL
jgi:hypothetical protein